MGTLMIAGGGTGGHIYPAIAVAQEYTARAPQRQVVFVGTRRGLETKIVPSSGFPLELVSVGGLKGKSALESLRNLLRLPLGLWGAWQLLSRHRPSAVLGVGGYASGPVLIVAALRRFPTMIHEQNAFPGITNRMLARVVREIAVAFPGALERFGRGGTVTGNPVRREFFTVARPSRASDRMRLLVFGGSQGSRVLNQTVSEALLFLARVRDRLEIVHQTGPADRALVAEAYRASAFPNARVVPYLDAMAEEMAAADLVVSRAGALTIGELTAVGRAAILVPFAAATNNHQEVNARVLEAAGGATVITESMLTPERLASAITEIITRPERAAEMGAAARRLASPDATKKIVEIIERIERN